MQELGLGPGHLVCRKPGSSSSAKRLLEDRILRHEAGLEIAIDPGEVVQSHAAKGRHVISVDMNKLPMAGLNSDGVHPNEAGSIKIADKLTTALQALPN